MNEPQAQDPEKHHEDHVPDLTVEASEDEYLTGLPLTLMSLALMAGIFMIALDNSIIATAIPKITSQFNSLNDVGNAAWYGTAYLLTTMSLQPTFGKIYTLFNLKWSYTAALFIFEVGSVVCAVAPNSLALIIGRAVAGVGAAGIMCGGLVFILHIVEMKKRPIFMGLVSSMFGVASVIGPTFGGLFTDSPRLTWRFCFWINLPFGALAILVILLVYKPKPREHSQLTFRQKLVHLGFDSAAVLTGAITCLLLVLHYGGIIYPWSDSRVWGCLLGFVLLIVLFVVMQVFQHDRALIPHHIIKKRTIIVCCLFSFFLQNSMTSQTYILPFFFQAVQGTTARISGLDILPYGITITITTIITGSIITLTGYHIPWMWLGSALLTTGAGLLHTLTRASPMRLWFPYQVIGGVGYGATCQIPFFAIQVVLTRTVDIPTASALIALSQSLGGAVGLAVSQNVFQNSLDRDLARIEGVDRQAVVASGGVGLEGVVPGEYLDAVRDAFGGGVADAFLLAVACAGAAFVVSLGVEWRRIESKKGAEVS
ncbi:MFS general substrate transporter [Coniochaeta ligniaria NRRL 30616]|uniref:MFS general substrate transporter n=1 Tax=Coniochaeta ligniaria NRRL 30616 TaxID=1408157 RepID=A0A1J7JMP5_9PEZI|nr:MFS general substrate transporter [Coniochaeta ligniaria NRRL 30616]